MRVEERADKTLVVTHDSVRAALFFLALGALAVAGAALDAFASDRGERFVALLGAAGTLLLIGLVMFERSRFELDPKTRTVRWSRRWAWWNGEGSIPFAQVAEVLVHSPIGDEGVPSRRIVLRVEGGRELPFTASFRPDGNAEIVELGRRLRVLLGQPPAAAADDVGALLRAGRRADAVKLLRSRNGTSLSEAVREIDAIRSRSR